MFDLPGRIRGVLAAAAVVVSLLALSAPASAATAVRQVSNGGADTGDCTAAACATIGYAIGQAANGDVVKVAAGTYNEEVAVTKRVSLEGAKAGVDARNRAGTADESVMNNAGGAFDVKASGVSIDGFRIENATTAPLGSGIALAPDASGYRVVNDIVQNNTVGLSLNSDGLSHSVVRHNVIKNNNAAGANSGNGIFGSDVLGDVSIDANAFSGHNEDSILLRHTRATDVSITNNTTTNDASIALYNTHGATIEGNSLIGGNCCSAIYLGGGNGGVDIAGNTVNNKLRAVRIEQDGASNQGPNHDVRVIGNTFTGNAARGILAGANALSDPLAVHFNRITGNPVGLENSNNPQVDAENNWWGCSAGPGSAGCDTLTGSVDGNPWLVLSATAERERMLTGGDANTISAGFISNSDLASIDASSFPATSIAFPPAILGTVATPKTTSGGVAKTLFVSGGTVGNGSVSATLDNQTATATFAITSQAGTQGPQGDKGDKGDTGGQGPAGANGADGQPGAQGPAGPAGPGGAQGPQGPQGAQGPQGPQGPNGPSGPASAGDPHPVAVVTKVLRASRQRVVNVAVSCPQAAGVCDGRVRLAAGRTTLGSAPFLVTGGQKANVRIKVSAKSLKAAANKKVTVLAFSRDNAGVAAFTTQTVAFRR